jgi:glucan phosphoethanolaminetransferase (alkaline phosphatase superfamily)
MNTDDDKKPLAVLILAWALLLFGIFQIFQIPFHYQEFSLGRHIWYFCIKFSFVIAAIGLLRFKRWGVYLYFFIFLIYTTAFYLIPPNKAVLDSIPHKEWVLGIIFVPTIIALIVLPYWKKFTQ